MVREKLIDQARHRSDHSLPEVVSRKRAKVVASFAFGLERLVVAFGKQLRMSSSQIEQPADDEQFLAAVLPLSRKIDYGGAGSLLQQSPPCTPVDRPTIAASGLLQLELSFPSRTALIM